MRDRVWWWDWLIWYRWPLSTIGDYLNLSIAFINLNKKPELRRFPAFWDTCWDWRMHDIFVVNSISWHSICEFAFSNFNSQNRGLKKKSCEALTKCESQDIVVGVTVVEADGFRLCGRNHKLIFEQNKFSHWQKRRCGTHKENLTNARQCSGKPNRITWKLYH
jgi:hypothetical protein